MIVAIEGIITKKEPTNCVIKLSNGISYSVNISLNCSAKLEKNAKIELLITQIIREDANLLFGFLDADEQKMFEMLIKLSGIGA
ncbi:MAG: Holliday junction branch migration protein RuvA, partial [Campylobacter sp.]|nr:Holliday junction branch migration protein RuvA [Campylobacter sp.]